MQIARIGASNAIDFAFRRASQTGWVTAASLGLSLSDLSELIGSFEEVRHRLEALGATPVEPAEWHAPVVRPGKILAVGLNYLKHIDEVGKPVPEEPMIFAKYSSALAGPYDDVVWPRHLTAELDYECELAVVIGRVARDLVTSEALDAVFGYCVANDVSARDLQRRQPQISLSKGMDTFCPVGPWLTTADDVLDPQALAVRTEVNGEVRQSSTTTEMLFGVAELVSYLSSRTTLEPGDVILTGTPAGVGSGMSPPGYLQAGDVVSCEISGLGRIENTVVVRPGER